MINYTEQLTRLIADILRRVPELCNIDPTRLLVFARFGRSAADGPFATCHSLNLPPSEPTYSYWRHPRTGRITKQSEWFVARSPEVRVGPHQIDYLLSFALPRFCDQTLDRGAKRQHYPNAEPWMAKLDTVVHELYHIDPDQPGIRRLERADGRCSTRSHAPGFFGDVARLVNAYLATGPSRATYDFLRFPFSELQRRFGGVVATTFATFPSYPQRYFEALDPQPASEVPVTPIRRTRGRVAYDDRDLATREFLARSSRPFRQM